MDEPASPRFLVVEDDSLVARALSKIVRGYGTVRVAGSVEQARRQLRGAAWSGLLIDLGLPDGSGLDVLADARRELPEVPVMVLTGRVERRAINAVFDLRAQYAVKPVSTARVRRFLAEATALNHPDRPPETLSEAIALGRALMARRADARTRYAVGALVVAVKAHPDRFGPGAVPALARALGQGQPTLYRHAWVAETLGEAELEALLARARRAKRKVTWSHIVALCSIPTPDARRALAARLLDEALSVRRFTALAVEAQET